MKLLIVALCCTAFTVEARAAVIEPNPVVTASRFSGQIYANTTNHNPYSSEGDIGGVGKDVTTLGQTVHRTSSSFSSLDLDLSHAPSISTVSEAGVLPNGSSEGMSGGQIVFYFQIAGPTTTNVPVLIQAKGETKVSGPEATSDARFSLQGTSGYVLYESLASNAERSIGNQSFSIDQYYNLVSNTEYMAIIAADSFAGNGALSGRSLSSAMVDPFFMIDPSYSQYSLIFSQGINNTLVSAVPLPASLPMFGAGLIGFVGFSYGRRHLQRAARLVRPAC